MIKHIMYVLSLFLQIIILVFISEVILKSMCLIIRNSNIKNSVDITFWIINILIVIGCLFINKYIIKRIKINKNCTWLLGIFICIFLLFQYIAYENNILIGACMIIK